MSYSVDVGRPQSGDIVEVILDDHRRIDDLLRALRDDTSDRAALREAVAAVLVAHAEAEEEVVYPKLRHRDAVSDHEAEHGQEEHAEGHAALLALLELKGTDTAAFDDALKELSTAVDHHLVEEELSILNPARDTLGARARADLGASFAQRRNQFVDDNCGRITNVRAIVARRRRDGTLDESEDDD